MEKATRLNVPFSVADAEAPSFSFDEKLDVRWTDWREQPVHVEFIHPVGVTWQEATITGAHDRDDDVFEIQDSEWLRAHSCEGVRERREPLRHFRLCFNAHGTLDVLASAMRQIRAQ